jgi:hypothetical protein
MKWTKAKHGSYIESGSWSIHKSSGAYALKIGWNFVCFLKTEAGCKRVANCIQREMKKANAKADQTSDSEFGRADGCNNSNKGE